MNKIINILCILSIILGASLFAITAIFFNYSSMQNWCYGLGAALIILGLGFLINSMIEFTQNKQSEFKHTYLQNGKTIPPKYKSGYLVCKLMNVFLCLFLLLLDAMNVEPLILLLGVVLVLIQFFLDLILQIYFAGKEK